MRVTLTREPVASDFPWNGSGSALDGRFWGGETEDYLVEVVPRVTGVDLADGVGVRLQSPVPNPSGGSARIAFLLPRRERIELAVYSTTGRKVRVLTGRVLEAGLHEAQWDGRTESGEKAPAGMYFLRLRTERESLSRTLVRLEP
jgi:hypothetical protein